MKSLVFVAIFGLVSINLAQAIVCPENFCTSVDCSANQAEIESCEGRVQAGGSVCGCCPACIKQLNEGDNCFFNFGFGMPVNAECGQGLMCHPTKKVCQKVSGESTTQAPKFKGPCHEEYFKKSQVEVIGQHLPQCLEDGSYAPVQCQESVCMCVDTNGKQIENFAVSIGQRSEMNCRKF